MKFVRLAIVSTFIPILCVGQITIDKIKKSRDYINTTITFHVIREVVKKDKSLSNRFHSIQDKFKDITVVNSYNFSTLSLILKDSFPKILQKLSAPINNISTNGLSDLSPRQSSERLVNMAYEILKKAYPTEYTHVLTLRDSLISEMEISYPPSVEGKQPTSIESPTDNISGPNITTLPGEDSSMNQSLGFFNLRNFNLWSLITLSIMFALSILGLKKINQLNYTIRELRTEIDLLVKNPKIVPDQGPKFDKMNAENGKKGIWEIRDQVENRFSTLELRITKLESNNDHDTPSPANLPSHVISFSDVFYMAGPVNNYFPNSVKSSTPENTVYKFTPNDDKRKATYEIHTSGAPINQIITMIESYIKPACDEENLPGTNVQKIINKSPGIAILEGDKWMIQTKALIRYE